MDIAIQIKMTCRVKRTAVVVVAKGAAGRVDRRSARGAPGLLRVAGAAGDASHVLGPAVGGRPGDVGLLRKPAAVDPQAPNERERRERRGRASRLRVDRRRRGHSHKF